MIYGAKLRNLRERNGITQQDLTEIIGLKDDAYGPYEREYTIIPITHLNTICNYFNVSLDYIFNFTETKQYENSRKEIDKNTVGTKLKEFRKDNKLTQVRLANVLNTNHSVIANYERGRNIIATPFLYTVCKKYQISADYLLGKIDFIPKW